MKKNKGQVLVMFLMFIPLLFMLMAIVVDIGLLYIEKRSIDNTIKYAIKESLRNDRTTEEIKTIISENCENITKLEINKTKEMTEVEFKGYKNNVFSLIFKNTYYNIESNLIGSIKEEKIIIKRVE